MTPRLFVPVLSSVTASACSTPPEMADVAGTYVLSIQTDTLVIESIWRGEVTLGLRPEIG